MFHCYDITEVNSVLEANEPRVVEPSEIYGEDVVIDSLGRAHAPRDGFVCPLTDRVFRAGEFLPTTDESVSTCWSLNFSHDGKTFQVLGTPAQIRAAKEVLIEQQKRVDRERSNHIGRVGERTELELTVRFQKEPNGYDLYPAWFNVCEDTEGNLVFYSGNKLPATCKVRCTIKKHTERDGVRGTYINRPKVL